MQRLRGNSFVLLFWMLLVEVTVMREVYAESLTEVVAGLLVIEGKGVPQYIEALLKKVDSQLYKAKDCGHGCVVGGMDE